MAEFDEQDRATSGSLIGNAVGILNPFRALKEQYFSIWGLPSYYSMARGGSTTASLFLGYSPEWANKLKDNHNILKRGIGHFFSGYKYDPLGSLSEELLNASRIAPESRAGAANVIRKNLAELLGKNKWSKMSKAKMYKMASSAVRMNGIGVKGSMALRATVAKRMSSAITMSRLGAIGSGLFTGVALGGAIAEGFNLWFKGALTTLDTFSAFQEQVRSLEFGGSLSSGYMSTEAVTERQRALREIQRSHVGGRRMLGSEAQLYAGGM